MPIITKVTAQQKCLDRYNIFMDFGKGEEYAFSVDEDVLIKFQLKKGLELDDFSLMEIHYHDDIRKAYNLAITYLSRMIRSEKEIKDYLNKKEIEDPVINEVIHKLKSQKYIDDHEYANAFVRTQINTTDKGPELIKVELKERGIDKKLSELALKEFALEQQLEKVSKLCRKFLQKNSKDSSKIVKQKLENLLARKGYHYEVINMAFSEIEPVSKQIDELEAIRFQGEKLQRKYSNLTGFEYEQKIKQALFRKGFSFDLIEKYVTQLNNFSEES
jgi:regulatory protein